ncbi:hypothetical protein BC936DRAFT_149500 [Jimgerdemannia flammicorona]|uniref:Uncharacterized protein n=1 Tax=Jimgerdemannia flammicorona TaxID=994334 RepID=A0A433DK11_9FUNG|nr:hypothetical protein BC936DRAFT_149500 [Jimgerdemannia flammicorona]
MATKSSPDSRPHLILRPDIPPFTPPPSIHPALAAIDIGEWTYQRFVSQIIILKIPIDSVQSAEQLWLNSLKLITSKKEIHWLYRSFIKRLMDFQAFEQLGDTEEGLNRYIKLRLHSQLSTSIKDVQQVVELQERETFTSSQVTNFLKSTGDNASTLSAEHSIQRSKPIIESEGISSSDGDIGTETGLKEIVTDEESKRVDNDEFGLKDKILFEKRKIEYMLISSILCVIYGPPNRFKAFEDSKKWKLQSGRFVEDILYQLGLKCRFHHPVHSFIIDGEDSFTNEAFTEEEMEEIFGKENGQDPPEIEEELLAYINTFAKATIILTKYSSVQDSTKEIREELNKRHPRLGANYDPQTDFAYEHVRTTVADCGNINTQGPSSRDAPQSIHSGTARSLVPRECLEDDRYCFLRYPLYFLHWSRYPTACLRFEIHALLFFRGEKSGLASNERKNRYRTLANVNPIQRKVIGKKGDGYVRVFGSIPTDWAASEAGSKWEGNHGTKLIKECGMSLPRTLKDILVNLAYKIKFSEDKLRKLNIVGFIHSGAVLIRTNLDCPAGYVCRYTRGEAFEVHANVNKFSESLDVLIEIVYAKASQKFWFVFLQILQTMKVVDSGAASEQEHHNITRWKRQNKLKRSDVATIPDCHPTPKKKR